MLWPIPALEKLMPLSSLTLAMNNGDSFTLSPSLKLLLFSPM